ncbi:hypothetical protein, partial [Bilophila wadsworthia]|uniref:hypothetical protein n=1 Tax=Bilophila wadsworthia TaxID=35833 RepID=UPI00242E99F6
SEGCSSYLGGDGEPFCRMVPLPLPTPTPSSPKTFALIESLFTDFPVFQEKELRLFFYLVKAMERQEERERKRERKPSPESSGEGLYLS